MQELAEVRAELQVVDRELAELRKRAAARQAQLRFAELVAVEHVAAAVVAKSVDT